VFAAVAACPSEAALKATCVLQPSTNSPVNGVLSVSQVGNIVRITGNIGGLVPGYHGFHVHQDGDTSNDCKAAGPHFNPSNAPHGAPGESEDRRHAGDLGNIGAGANGVAKIDVVTNQISLVETSPLSAVGRAIVVHEKADDLGKGGDEESLKTGNAGARLACCVITRI